MNTFQTFQPVKVNNPELPHNGRAGHVCSGERTEGTGKAARQWVDVMLDANDDDGAGAKPQQAVSFQTADLLAL